MGSTPVNGGNGDNFSSIVQKYADLQKEAYTSQSVTKEEVESLKSDLESYFEAHPDAKQKDITAKLDEMAVMADAHTKDTSHTDNDEWDSARESMDSLIKDLAPKGTDTSAIDEIPHGGGGAGAGATGGTQDVVTGGSGSTKGAGAGKFLGADMVSFDTMIQKFPQLAKYKQVLQSAADKYNIPVQLLAAQAMQESHANASEKGGGMFQFIPSTWTETMGQHGYEFNDGNVQLQADMAAKYDAQLLKAHGNDLNSMLREYNGPVSGAGIPEYQADIMKWMKGIDGYTG